MLLVDISSSGGTVCDEWLKKYRLKNNEEYCGDDVCTYCEC